MVARFLIAVIAILLCLAAHYTLAQTFWYTINVGFNTLLWRTKVSGPLPVEPQQGAVIVCNHRSGIDPLLIQMATDRVVHWMVAREYFAYRIMAACFDALGSIPVNRRGIDTAATKQAIRLAKEGKLVGLFPEGKINTSGDLLLPGRSGAALIAIKAGVPVIPCYTSGAPYNGTALGPLLMRANARVTIGKPIDLGEYLNRDSDREVLADLTKRFLKEIAHLAGDDAFEPKLAGKISHAGDSASAGDDDAAGDPPAQAGENRATGNGSPASNRERGEADDESHRATTEG